MNESNQILEVAIILLAAATLVGIVTRRFRLPYTVGLVLIGLSLGLINREHLFALPGPVPDLVKFIEASITPEFIMGLLVTPLIFEAAFHLNWNDLKRDLGLILVLAIPGVAITTFLVGGIVLVGGQLSDLELTFPVALLFGAMISPTDPVSVIALFRYLGVPKRLQILMEGESLFNDGTAIVLFTLVLGVATSASQVSSDSQFQIGLQYFAEFLRVSGGGLIVGIFMGWMVSQVIAVVDDHLIETTLTTVLAFSAFLIAEFFHVSGVLAVVAAGLVNGNVGPKGMSPTTRILVTNFWEYAAFLSNSVIFLLIGIEIDLGTLISKWQPTLLAIVAVLFSRLVVVYGTVWMNTDISMRYRHIMFWGGLRGAISLVLALSIPFNVAWRVDLQNMAFGVVLFTILFQGITMRPLVRRLHLTERSEMQEEYERRHARAVASRAAYDHLQKMYQQGLISTHTWNFLRDPMKQHAGTLASAVKDVIEIEPLVEAEELDTVRRETLRAERSSLISLLTDGIISEEVYSQLARQIDLQLSRDQQTWINLIKELKLERAEIDLLVSAIVQIQDVENAINALTQEGILVTRLSSSGGFLGRRNVTLLIGIQKDLLESVTKILARTCRRRVEYVSTPLEGSPFHLPLSTPVTIGGATVFTLQVEHYEEL
ncbi:MAG TPA: cyclic-di-AMP receptor [Anaerolineales bacterium]|nr:cyclic-di-AMP receptor [Anaerolineales bacterium]